MHKLSSFDLITSLYTRWETTHDHLADTNALTWLGDIEETWSYAELIVEIEHSAAYLESLGLRSKDILGLQAPRSLHWLTIFLGALSRGIIVLLLNESYTPTELKYYLNDAGALVAFTPYAKHHNLSSDSDLETRLIAAEDIPIQRRLHGQLETSKHLNPNDLAVLAYTSGTTGQPKGARIRHRDIMGTLEALDQAWEWSSKDRLIHTLPLFHIHGLFVAALGSLWAGAQIFLLPRFEALTTLKAVEKYNATVLMAVPTHHHRYLKISESERPQVKSLRLVTSGSAPLSSEQFEAFQAAFGIEIVERYGMTEIGIVLSAKLNGLKKPGSVGFPLPGVQAKICNREHQEVLLGDVGELHISSSSLFDGYHHRPQATAASVYTDHQGQRWMKTGDICYQDSDGMYCLKGRASEMIISGGLNVYPKEIEIIISDLGQLWIDEVAVVGLPDLEWGERVEAFITTLDHHPASKKDIEQLHQDLSQVLASYKRPKRISWLKELPRNSMGKLQRFKLRETSSLDTHFKA